jgi:hypothetical protein
VAGVGPVVAAVADAVVDAVVGGVVVLPGTVVLAGAGTEVPPPAGRSAQHERLSQALKDPATKTSIAPASACRLPMSILLLENAPLHQGV